MKVECRLHDYIKPDYNEGESKPLIVRGSTLIVGDRVEVQIEDATVEVNGHELIAAVKACMG